MRRPNEDLNLTLDFGDTPTENVDLFLTDGSTGMPAFSASCSQPQPEEEASLLADSCGTCISSCGTCNSCTT